MFERIIDNGKVVVNKVPTKSNVVRLPIPDEKINISESMKRKGMLSLKTPNGFPFDQASSSLQKAVRRCNTEEAIQWAIELFYTSNNARTNVWNRLLVMCVEDVSPNNYSILESIYNLFINERDNEQAIITCAYNLALSLKSRMFDWSLHYAMDKPTLIDNPYEISSSLSKAIDCKDLDEMLFLCNILQNSKVKLDKPVFRSKIATNLIWKELLDKFGNNSYIQTLFSIYKLPTWRRSGKSKLLWSAACNVICNEFNGTYPRFVSNANLSKGKLIIKDDRYIEDVLVGVPDYALDKHTRAGRKMGRNLNHFIEKSSAVVNEDLQFIDKVNFYIKEII